MGSFGTLDLVLFFGYLIFMVGIGIFLSFRNKKKDENSTDYFLASKALPWWAVGGSLIASNISAEQFIGMSGSGYVVGMAIATYELMAAATLLLVAKFFIPVFIDRGIFTMPQFLEDRFNGFVRSGMAVFWLLLFVFVNITTVLHLGALSMEGVLGVPYFAGIVALALYSATFSIFGGLRTVVWTDVIQVVVLMLGGLLTSYLVLNALSDGAGFMAGMNILYDRAPEKFEMIIDQGHSSYMDLPGWSVIFGGMWIANIYYWGNNQYIIQRALASKSIGEAQKGIAFAAFMKILLPLIVVIPGIAAFVLIADLNDPILTAAFKESPDKAYGWVLGNYVTTGFKGIAFAALVAAIGSSVSSIVNSISTIFTLDIYKRHIEEEASQSKLVKVGKITAAASLLIGIAVAPFLKSVGEAFQFIQEYTGFISPGVVVIFLFGLFWKKASSTAAMAVVAISIPLSVALKFGAPTIPFIDRMGICFLVLSAIMIGISLMTNSGKDPKGYEHASGLFKTSATFNIASLLICGILAAIYAIFN